MNSFKKPPKLAFVAKMLPAALGVFLLSAVLMALLAPKFAFGPELFQVSEICLPGEAQSEFNKERCDRFWTEWLVRAAIAALPLWLSLAFLFFAYDSMNVTYKRIRKQIEAAPKLKTGTVTDPARTSNDWFGWSHGLESVSVQLESGEQTRVYVAAGSTLPLPGEKLALVEIARGKGPPRLAGVHFAPHIAIFRG